MDLITITGNINQTTGVADLVVDIPAFSVFFLLFSIYLFLEFFKLAIKLWK